MPSPIGFLGLKIITKNSADEDFLKLGVCSFPFIPPVVARAIKPLHFFLFSLLENKWCLSSNWMGQTLKCFMKVV